MTTTTTPPPNLAGDDYSTKSTTIKFDHPLPLLHSPTPSNPPDNPHSHVLAFKTLKSYANKLCESQILTQCETGSRIGCAIVVSNNCKPPWLRFIDGKIPDLKEREICEKREMEGCLAAAKGKCVGLTKDKSAKPFRDARIEIEEREVKRFLALALAPSKMEWRNLTVMRSLIGFNEIRFGTTNYRASELLGSEVANYDRLLKSR